MDDIVPQEVGSLQEHETASAARAAHLEQDIKLIEKEIEMTTPDVNIFQKDGLGSMLPLVMGNMGGGTGAAMGGGLGAGLLGGILGGVLLNRNGVLGGGVGDGAGVVTPTMLATSLGTVTESANNSTILQTLGDIKAAIPYNEAQVQLALSGAQADINGNINSNALATALAFSNTNSKIAETAALAAANSSDVRRDIAAANAVNIASFAGVTQAIGNSTYQLASTIRDDGDKTRALLIAQNDATLNRQLQVAESALAEQRSAFRARDTEINITQNVNQNQVQSQQQQQLQVLTNALAVLANQQQHISQGIVNLGTMSGGSGNQTAANTKVH